MEKTPTAEEFAKKHHPMKTYPADWNVMIEFAKLHVQEALKQASENVVSYVFGATTEVDKESILNSYPLENIK
jgi:hypothetical protein